MTRATCFGLTLALLVTGLSPAWAEELLTGSPHVFSVPGDGGWDYLTYDPAADRVFIGRPQGVQVVDAGNGKVIAMIGAPTGDHGVVLAPAADRLFTSDEKENRLGVFALSTLRPLGTVPLPGEPDGLVMDTATGRVLALIPERQQVVAVDAASAKVLGTIDVGGEPEAGVVDGTGAVFVTVRDKDEIVRLDAAKMAVAARWASDCERPTPITMDTATRRLFIGCGDGRLLVLDAADGHPIASVPTGETTDAAVFDRTTKIVALANGGGSISLVGEKGADDYALIGNIETPRGARTMTLDPKGGRLFTATADIDSIDPPTADRPYPLLHTKPGTFRLIVLRPAAMR